MRIAFASVSDQDGRNPKYSETLPSGGTRRGFPVQFLASDESVFQPRASLTRMTFEITPVTCSCFWLTIPTPSRRGVCPTAHRICISGVLLLEQCSWQQGARHCELLPAGDVHEPQSVAVSRISRKSRSGILNLRRGGLLPIQKLASARHSRRSLRINSRRKPKSNDLVRKIRVLQRT